MVRSGGGGGGELGGSIHRLHTSECQSGDCARGGQTICRGEGWLGDFTVFVSMPLRRCPLHESEQFTELYLYKG